MEERRFRRIEVFGGCILLQRPSAEADETAAEIADGEHHPIAEPVIGHGNVIARDQQPGFDHIVARNPEAAEMLLEGEAFGWGIADAKLKLGRGIEPAVREIAPRLGAGAGRERRLEEFGGKLDHIVERAAAVRLRLRFGAELGNCKACKRG